MSEDKTMVKWNGKIFPYDNLKTHTLMLEFKLNKEDTMRTLVEDAVQIFGKRGTEVRVYQKTIQELVNTITKKEEE